MGAAKAAELGEGAAPPAARDPSPPRPSHRFMSEGAVAAAERRKKAAMEAAAKVATTAWQRMQRAMLERERTAHPPEWREAQLKLLRSLREEAGFVPFSRRDNWQYSRWVPLEVPDGGKAGGAPGGGKGGL